MERKEANTESQLWCIPSQRGDFVLIRNACRGGILAARASLMLPPLYLLHLPSRRRYRILTSSSFLKSAVFNVNANRLANIPAKVVQVAGQPMVRAGTFGVVGNVREVAEARTLVLKKLGDHLEEDSVDVGPSKKKRKLQITVGAAAASQNLVTRPNDKLPAIVWENVKLKTNIDAYTCPRCGGAI